METVVTLVVTAFAIAKTLGGALLAPAFALVGALGGVLITQRRSDKREAIAWIREQERERARWEREDRALTFEHRRQVYVSFYEALRETSLAVDDHHLGRSQLQTRWYYKAYTELQCLMLYASPVVTRRAQAAYISAVAYGHEVETGGTEEAILEERKRCDDDEDFLVEAIRTDLKVPGSGTVPKPPA